MLRRPVTRHPRNLVRRTRLAGRGRRPSLILSRGPSRGQHGETIAAAAATDLFRSSRGRQVARSSGAVSLDCGSKRIGSVANRQTCVPLPDLCASVFYAGLICIAPPPPPPSPQLLPSPLCPLRDDNRALSNGELITGL